MNELYTKEGSWHIFEELQDARSYPAQDLIYRQGEQAEQFYYLKKGKVKIFLSSENGIEKTLTILTDGTLFGEAAFFDGLPRVSSARAVTDCELISIGHSELLRFFSQKPELAMRMLRYLSRTVRMLSAQVDNMTFLQADTRIARLLLQLADERGEISITHEELGSLAGASRVTASKILNRFVKLKWIHTGYRTVQILNGDKLIQFANETTGKEGR